jgi:hypothetical protein
MQPGPYEKVPLKDEEKDQLRNIYRLRGRFFFSVYAILIPFAFAYSFRGIDSYANIGSVSKDNAVSLSADGMWLVNLSVLGGIVIGSGVLILFKRILPFKKDAASGVKEKIPFTIIRREYFPLTNQFFVALDDPDYLHHEIDEDIYHKCAEGDTIYLYRGVQSKYISEENGRFSII